MIVLRLSQIWPACLGVILMSHVGIAGQDCSSECKDASEQYDKIEKNIERMAKIKASNIEFLSLLDASQESQRIKVKSNIRIAEKRMTESEAKKKEFDHIKNDKNCLNCEKS
jgi:hypothetical protein